MLYQLTPELWEIIRSFLYNCEIVETLLIDRPLPNSSVWTSLTVRATDDLMRNIRVYLAHRRTLQRTILFGIQVDDEWPFETREMILVRSPKKTPFSPKVQKVKSLSYDFQVSQKLYRPI